MSTEVYTPVPLNPETAEQHEIVRGESTDNQGFLDATLEAQSENSIPEKKHRKEVVDSISPENVHLYGKATLDKVLVARELIHSDEFQAHTKDERDEIIAELLDSIMAGDDNNSVKYMTHRFKLGDMLMQTSEKFKKTKRQKEVDQARRDRVKLRKPSRGADENSESFSQRVKGLFEREPDDSPESSQPLPTTAKLDKAIKRLDRRNSGLVGKIAETGTKTSFLRSRLDAFRDQMEAHGANVNARTRRSVERETIGKLVDTHGLADAKGLEGDERRAYITELIDTFHGYTQLSDEDRQDLHESLSDRYGAAKERHLLQREADNAPEKISSVSRIKRSLGELATKALDLSAKRWESRKGNSGEPENVVDGDSDDTTPNQDRSTHDKLRDVARTAGELPLVGYHNMMAYLANRSDSRREKLADMTDEERENHSERKAFIGLGITGVALVATSLYYMKYGLDNPFNNGGHNPSGVAGDRSSGGLGDLLQVPDAGSPDKQDIVSGIEINPQGGGQEGLTRAELFDGSRGTRSLSTENAQHLSSFLDSYKVKDGDNQGVWGISEKYLQSQGVKNPTVFETDAVKDYILKHSSLTNSTIIHPGDTIRLK